MNAGLTARIALRRCSPDCASLPVRCRQRTAQSSKAAGSANNCLTAPSFALSSAASASRWKVRVKSAWFIAVARREQADLLAQPCLMNCAEFLHKGIKQILRLGDRLLLLLGKQRQQAFREPHQVPQSDRRLVGVGIAASLVDR